MVAFSNARHAVILTMSGPLHYVRMNSRQNVQLPPMPEMPEKPALPDLPRIPLQRD